MKGIRRALVLGLVLIAGTVIGQAPSVGPRLFFVCEVVVVPYVDAVVRVLLIVLHV